MNAEFVANRLNSHIFNANSIYYVDVTTRLLKTTRAGIFAVSDTYKNVLQEWDSFIPDFEQAISSIQYINGQTSRPEIGMTFLQTFYNNP